MGQPQTKGTEAAGGAPLGGPSTSGRQRQPRSRSSVNWRWALALILPYLVLLVIFAVYPVIYELIQGLRPTQYQQLWQNPVYRDAIINTVVFVGISVNIKMVLSLLLSGFFAKPSVWRRLLGIVLILPWAAPEVASLLSFRWMLNSSSGLLNTMIEMAGLPGQPWLDRPSFALGSAIAAHVWKLMPFWTLVLLAGRLAIPQQVYEASSIDGAGRWQTFAYITWPLIAGLYVTSTVLATVWAVGDFNSIYLVTGGGPADSTQVLSTLGVQYAFTGGSIPLGVSVVLTALPLLIPAVIFLVSRAMKGGVFTSTAAR